ncbi:MAG TPA: metalloregulator ArsR/SmtB family transcription factor [Gemmatimonadaceae bacterium]|nr:metalloregulator ArsR/SmtB family transcription factor [Gemmatimonadaceae bacterium]
MRTVSKLFKALSEDTRLEILALLLHHGELCVCDVEQVLAVTQSKASRHLRYLLSVGLVEDRRDGLWVRYRIVDAPNAEQQVVLDALRALLHAEHSDAIESRFDQWMAEKRQLTAAPVPSCRTPVLVRIG